jgi:hypothetical protein
MLIVSIKKTWKYHRWSRPYKVSICFAVDVSTYLGPHGNAGGDTAERVLCRIVAAHGGSVSTKDLAKVYGETPWLKRGIGRLEDFCLNSARLAYIERGCQGSRARVTLCSPEGSHVATSPLDEPHDALKSSSSWRQSKQNNRGTIRRRRRHDGRENAKYFENYMSVCINFLFHTKNHTVDGL